MRRLWIYLMGVFFGIVLVYFMLIRGRDRDLAGDWLPSDRVVKMLAKKELEITAAAACMIQCNGLDSGSVDRLLKDGEVDFSKSKPRDEPRIFVVAGKQEDKRLSAKFEVSENTSKLISIRQEDKSINCDCD